MYLFFVKKQRTEQSQCFKYISCKLMEAKGASVYLSFYSAKALSSQMKYVLVIMVL